MQRTIFVPAFLNSYLPFWNNSAIIFILQSHIIKAIGAYSSFQVQGMSYRRKLSLIHSVKILKSTCSFNPAGKFLRKHSK